jgi:hypothetical protein
LWKQDLNLRLLVMSPIVYSSLLSFLPIEQVGRERKVGGLSYERHAQTTPIYQDD